MMSELPDPAAWRWLVENLAIPALSGLWALLAFWVNKIAKQFEKQDVTNQRMQDRMTQIEVEIPKTYATHPSVDRAVREAVDEMKDHVDTIRTDVRTLHGDVKDLLKMFASRT